MTNLTIQYSHQTSLSGTLDDPLEGKRFEFPEIIVLRAQAGTDTRGIAWKDPNFGINWPITPDEAIVFQRDLDRPPFAELQGAFYDEPLN